MTETEARNANVGDKVQWPDGTYGEVIEKGYAAFKVRWNDGQYSVVPFGLQSELRDKIATASNPTPRAGKE